MTIEERLADLMAQLEALKSGNKSETKPKAATQTGGGKKYRLLKTEVSWSTTPQVHAIISILGAHAKPGDVLEESHIVNMMIQNEAVLKTTQGGKRIWNYYKGDHSRGLMAHGNVELV